MMSPFVSPACAAVDCGSTDSIIAPSTSALPPAPGFCYLLSQGHPYPASLDLAIGDQLSHDEPSHIDGNSETNADVAAGFGEYRGIDAGQAPVKSDQGAARIAGIDRGVRLDEVLVAFDAQSGTTERRDNS